MKFSHLLLLAAVAAFTFVGSAYADDSAPINDTCPIKGKAVDDSKSVEFTATFCCDKCVAKFKKDPGKYAEDLASAEEGKCAFSGKDLDPDATATITIGTCCGGCKKKVTAEPLEYLGDVEVKS